MSETPGPVPEQYRSKWDEGVYYVMGAAQVLRPFLGELGNIAVLEYDGMKITIELTKGDSNGQNQRKRNDS